MCRCTVQRTRDDEESNMFDAFERLLETAIEEFLIEMRELLLEIIR